MSTAQDAGLQPQRASLAWTRTAMVMAINALLILRAGIQTDDVLLLAAGVLLGLLSSALVWAHRARQRELEKARPPAPSRRLMLLTSAGTVLAAGAGLLIVLR